MGISSAFMSKSGYHHLKMLPNSPFSVRTRVCCDWHAVAISLTVIACYAGDGQALGGHRS
jgi:hypothetical protein